MYLWAWIETRADGTIAICERGGILLFGARREPLDTPSIERELRRQAVARQSTIRLAQLAETDTKRIIVGKRRRTVMGAMLAYQRRKKQPGLRGDVRARVGERGAIVGIILPTPSIPRFKDRGPRAFVSFPDPGTANDERVAAFR